MRSLIYPVPDPALPFLGVHLTRHIAGDVLVGPTALMAPARDAYRLGTVRAARPRRDARLAGHLADGPASGGAPGLSELRHAASRRRVRAAPPPGTCPS